MSLIESKGVLDSIRLNYSMGDNMTFYILGKLYIIFNHHFSFELQNTDLSGVNDLQSTCSYI